MPQTAVRASVDVATIRQRFNYDWAMDPDNGADEDTYWWYACSIRVDPNEVIADDEEGNLWSIPFTTDGEDNVTFSAPVRVRETYVPISAPDGAAATAVVSRRAQRVIASSLTRPEKPGDSTHPARASASSTNQQEETMDEQVRAFLVGQGLDPETATEEQINAATVFVTEPASETTDPTPVADPAPEPVADPAPAAPETAAAATTVTVSRQVWEDTQNRLGSLETERTERETAAATTRRDHVVEASITAGQITRAEREHYRGLLDIDEARTTALLAGLAAGRVPVLPAKGDARADAASSTEDALLAATLPRIGVKTEA